MWYRSDPEPQGIRDSVPLPLVGAQQVLEAPVLAGPPAAGTVHYMPASGLWTDDHTTNQIEEKFSELLFCHYLIPVLFVW